MYRNLTALEYYIERPLLFVKCVLTAETQKAETLFSNQEVLTMSRKNAPLQLSLQNHAYSQENHIICPNLLRSNTLNHNYRTFQHVRFVSQNVFFFSPSFLRYTSTNLLDSPHSMALLSIHTSQAFAFNSTEFINTYQRG